MTLYLKINYFAKKQNEVVRSRSLSTLSIKGIYILSNIDIFKENPKCIFILVCLTNENKFYY